MKPRTTEWDGLNSVRAMRDIPTEIFGLENGERLRQSIKSRALAALNAQRARREALATLDDLRAHAERLRALFWESVGGRLENTPLCPQKMGELACDGYVIEKIVFQTRPGAYLCANLYLPDREARDLPAVLVCPGHADAGKAFPQYQYVAQALVRTGFAAMLFDPFGQGEKCEYFDSTIAYNPFGGCSAEHDNIDWQLKLAGESLARYVAHDCARAIDYLASRAEIDASRIAITGNSGGGTMCHLAMLTCFEKLAAAAPCSYVTSEAEMLEFGIDTDNEQNWPGMLGAGVDYVDELLAMAGKPVMLLVNRYDYFPSEGAERTYREAQKYWEMLGKGDNLALALSDTKHEYAKSLAARLAEFLSEKLTGEKRSPQFEFVCRAVETLHCTHRGQAVCEFEDYKTIRAALDERLIALKTARAGQDGALPFLENAVFAGRGAEKPNLKILSEGALQDMAFFQLVWHGADGLLSSGMLFEPIRGAKGRLRIAIWPEGTRALVAHAWKIRRWTQAGERVLVLDVTGMGAQEPAALANCAYAGLWGTKYRLATQLIRLGDSLMAIMIYDGVQAVRAMREYDGSAAREIFFYGEAELSLVARLSAMLARLECEINSELASFSQIAEAKYYDNGYWEAWSLPGVLAAFDF